MVVKKCGTEESRAKEVIQLEYITLADALFGKHLITFFNITCDQSAMHTLNLQFGPIWTGNQDSIFRSTHTPINTP